jgi:hypothetical protein
MLALLAITAMPACELLQNQCYAIISGNIIVDSYTTLTINGGGLSIGDIYINPLGTLNVNSGIQATSLEVYGTLNNSFILNVSEAYVGYGGVFNDSPGCELDVFAMVVDTGGKLNEIGDDYFAYDEVLVSGTMNLEDGAMLFQGSSMANDQLYVYGFLNVDSTSTIYTGNSAYLEIDGTLANAGTIHIGSSGSDPAQQDGSVSIYGTLINTGTINFNSDVINVGTFTNTGTTNVNSALVNVGTVDNSAGTINVYVTAYGASYCDDGTTLGTITYI